MLPELDGKEIDNPEVVCYSAHPKNKWSKTKASLYIWLLGQGQMTRRCIVFCHQEPSDLLVGTGK